jgi:hypothetical protein
MAECWEAFSLNKKVSELNTHTFQSYRIQLVKDSEANVSSTTEASAVQSRSVKRVQATNMVTPPAAKRQQRDGAASSSSVDSVARNDMTSPSRNKLVVLPKYDKRTRVGEVVASYHPEGLPAMTNEPRKGGRFVFKEFDNNIQKPYRHMFSTVEERAAALEKQLAEMGNEIVERYGISDGENGIAPLEQVNIPRQEKVCCVGRICNEVRRLSPLCSFCFFLQATRSEILTHVVCSTFYIGS